MLLALLLLFPKGPAVDLDVTYSKVGGEEVKMDIYRPATANGPTPAAVVIHGGAWMGGTRKDMAAVAQALAQNGVTAACISYRLAPKHKWPAMLDDSQTAVRFLRANATKYNINPNRIGATGASAGGHLSLFLGVSDTRDPNPTEHKGTSSKVKAVLDIFGPTDLTNQTDFPPGPLVNMLAVQVFGKTKPEEVAEAAKSASPIFLVTKDDAPVFILQGMADPLVKPNQSKILEKKLKEIGIRCECAYVEGMAHALPMENAAVKAAADKALAWFVAELKR